MKLKSLVILFLFVASSNLFAQFNRQDTLRGSITPERSWWDLNYYHLDVEVLPETKRLHGKNTIRYQVLTPYQTIQIDLQRPLKLDSVLQDGKKLKIKSEINAHFIELEKPQVKGNFEEIIVYYSGTPVEAKRPPWDGGITWTIDSKGNSFIASSCQGIGASIWWPCKDHMYDEVDSMLISVTVPKGLVDVSNGRLRSVQKNGETDTYNWFVSNPINNYGVNINIGNYVNFQEIYNGEKGPLDVDYWVLEHNLEKAKKQFKQVPMMLEAFEYWFGPYPFYEDSYKLVEAPYLGMEHQSSVTYGNQYKNGYLGRDLSGTGWGLKFDFIIIHESGHEWFANNITYKDAADMWVHEGFTNYSENLYLDYHFSKDAAREYVIGTRRTIQNDAPIIGTYGVNSEGSGDMYSKGGNMIHMIRTILDDDDKWREILRGMNEEFYHQTVTTQQIESYVDERIPVDLTKVFDQYLRTTQIPEFHYKFEGSKLTYKWTNCIEGFNMPLDVMIGEKVLRLNPTTSEKSLNSKSQKLTISADYYVKSKKLD